MFVGWHLSMHPCSGDKDSWLDRPNAALVFWKRLLLPFHLLGSHAGVYRFSPPNSRGSPPSVRWCSSPPDRTIAQTLHREGKSSKKGSSQEEPPRRTLSSIRNDSTFKSSPVATSWNHNTLKSSSETAGSLFWITRGLWNRCTLVCLLPHCTRHVWELTSSHSRTQCFFVPCGQELTQPLCITVIPCFWHLFPLPSLFLLLFFSVSLCISPSFFQAVGMSDIALSGLYYPPPLPHSSSLLSCSPLSKRRRRRRRSGFCSCSFLCMWRC